jgi:ketosteroid isomerase-like protein
VTTRAIVVVLTLTVLPGCGSSAPDPQAEARAAVLRFGEASARKDYQAICDKLITPALVRGVESIGLPCELAFKQGLGSVRKPTLEVLSVAVKGDTASARVASGAEGQQPSNDTLRLERRHGSWRIASLAGG